MRSRASSFKLEYPLLSPRSSSNSLRLLPRLFVTSIRPFIFPSITFLRRQFLRKLEYPLLSPSYRLYAHLFIKVSYLFRSLYQVILRKHDLSLKCHICVQMECCCLYCIVKHIRCQRKKMLKHLISI
jgi:hypothetical protein